MKLIVTPLLLASSLFAAPVTDNGNFKTPQKKENSPSNIKGLSPYPGQPQATFAQASSETIKGLTPHEGGPQHPTAAVNGNNILLTPHDDDDSNVKTLQKHESFNIQGLSPYPDKPQLAQNNPEKVKGLSPHEDAPQQQTSGATSNQLLTPHAITQGSRGHVAELEPIEDEVEVITETISEY